MRSILALAGAMALAACATVDSEPAVRLVQPASPLTEEQRQVLFWNDATRADRFRRMETFIPGHEVAAAPKVRRLSPGTPLDPAAASSLDAYLAGSGAAGIMVLQDGRVRYEKYGLGFGPTGRWTSFSVAKSFTSTLLGAAVKDGFIASMSDPVTKYLPKLAGTAYEGVSVEQLATMTSGVKWNEDYADPRSDVAQMLQVAPAAGENQAISYARKLTREAPAGRKWVYKTLETNLIGDLVAAATGQSLAAYAKTKIVDPAGFSGPLYWMTDLTGANIGGCCISLRLSDYARMGQFALEGGQPSVPAGWFTSAGAPQVDFGNGSGYGYQWWTYPGGNYGAQGIFGQSILIVPERRLVVAIVSSWPAATGKPLSDARRAIYDSVVAASAR